MAKNRRKTNHCYNCESKLNKSENFCPNCGQENHERQVSTYVLIDDFLKDFFTFDSKFFRSLRPLFFSPGLMTMEYLNGKQKKYIPPIRFYLFLSFLYFGVSYLTSDFSVKSVSFDGAFDNEVKTPVFLQSFIDNLNIMIFSFVPFQALIIMLFFRSVKRKYYVSFIVYSLHLYTLLFALFTFLLLLNTGVSKMNINKHVQEFYDLIIVVLVIVYLAYFIYKSLKLVFEKKHTILLQVTVTLLSALLFTLYFTAYFLSLAWFYLD